MAIHSAFVTYNLGRVLTVGHRLECCPVVVFEHLQVDFMQLSFSVTYQYVLETLCLLSVWIKAYLFQNG